MAITEAWNPEKNNGNVAPAPAEKRAPGAKEILDDPEEKKVFLEFLEKEGDAELIERINKQELNATDFTGKLETRRKEFFKLNERRRELESHFNEDDIKDIIKGTDLEKVANNVSIEAIREALTRNLKHVMVQDRVKFNAMAANMSSYFNSRKALGQQEVDLRKIMKENDFTEDELGEAMRAKDPEKALTKLFKSRMSIFERWGARGSKGSQELEERVRQANKGSEIEAIYSQLDWDRRGVAFTMNATLFGNEQVKKSLNEAFAGSKKEKPEEKKNEPPPTGGSTPGGTPPSPVQGGGGPESKPGPSGVQAAKGENVESETKTAEEVEKEFENFTKDLNKVVRKFMSTKGKKEWDRHWREFYKVKEDELKADGKKPTDKEREEWADEFTMDYLHENGYEKKKDKESMSYRVASGLIGGMLKDIMGGRSK